MRIHQVHLITSAVSPAHYPEHDLPEFLLLGRSNVGKSSFINTIINRKALARTSSQPGKTRTVNFYNVEDQFSFVDMPGYGYAKVSKSERQQFRKMIQDYIENRDNLVMVIQLIDFRHKPSEDDVAVHGWLMEHGIIPMVVATKVDKISKNQRPKNIKDILNTLKLEREDLILFSAETKDGKEEVETVLDEVLQILEQE
ncbi:YihA family ribosome biogenesis GTP-binding protein [Alkalibacter rhizosphaerae]|uniref:Probable GTP-binding protein EngB n=1 Tax=Alkalibacter rhizosphaerae TaxID=2815577 RepID=A0A975AH34_9FIRM|nr:ribosome biogenesis GTP-binding protein YihA/YsxC [Alkalibacter rhizosphaerae]QSX08194.1 YihA family ribosome biogenesis GTP-binding protein [Alkalibacter rhizosphaerae]